MKWATFLWLACLARFLWPWIRYFSDWKTGEFKLNRCWKYRFAKEVTIVEKLIYIRSVNWRCIRSYIIIFCLNNNECKSHFTSYVFESNDLSFCFKGPIDVESKLVRGNNDRYGERRRGKLSYVQNTCDMLQPFSIMFCRITMSDHK